MSGIESIMPSEKNIQHVISEIELLANGKTIVNESGKRFFGEITLCIQHGEKAYVKRTETIK